MKYFGWLVLLTLLAGCAPKKAGVESAAVETTTPAGEQLIVMTYNIRAGSGDGETKPGPPTKETLGKIAALIREENADVVLLQEVDNGVKRSGGIDEAGFLASELGFQSAFGDAIDLQGGKYGVAILSRWPITESEILRLPHFEVPGKPEYYSEPRVGLGVTIQAPHGTLRALCTHLGLTADQRAAQVGVLTAWLANAAAEGPVVFGGDLNATPDAAELMPVRALMTDSYGAFKPAGTTPLTFPSGTPDRCIDFVFVSPMLKPVESRVPDAKYSDHRAMVAKIEW